MCTELTWESWSSNSKKIKKYHKVDWFCVWGGHVIIWPLLCYPILQNAGILYIVEHYLLHYTSHIKSLLAYMVIDCDNISYGLWNYLG